MEQNVVSTVVEPRRRPLDKLKPPMSRLRELLLENALEACAQPDAKRTQEWLLALQMLEGVEDMREARKKKPKPEKENNNAQPGSDIG